MNQKMQAVEEKLTHLERQMSRASLAIDRANETIQKQGRTIKAKNKEIRERKRRERILLILFSFSILCWLVLLYACLFHDGLNISLMQQKIDYYYSNVIYDPNDGQPLQNLTGSRL